ncbi:MAG TPA: hypothetical protein ENG33_02405 [Chloroflexi bacterium]|nr:hypothetical protein [Chloroflexota bacterium]
MGLKSKGMRPFNLTLYLSITTLIAVILLTLCITYFFGHKLTESIMVVSERYALNIARGIGFQIFRDFTLPLRLRGETVNLQDPSQLRLLHRVVRDNLSGFGIEHLDIYDETGKVIYSTDVKRIGWIEADDPHIEQALKGEIVSFVETRSIKLPIGKTREISTIVTCVPIGLKKGEQERVERFKGIFCLRQDITPLRIFLLRTKATIVGGILAFMALFFAVLLLIARSADNIIRRQTETIRRKNQELEELEKLKRDLINMIVHDMKNPLTAITGNIDLVLEGIGGEVQPRQREFLKRAQLNGQRLLAMISNLLDISKMEEGKLVLEKAPFNLREVVDEVVADSMAIAVEEDKEITVDIPEGLPPLNADREMIRRVLANLVSNAIKHTFEGGHIKIAARMKGEEMWISVQDDGEGIPPEYHQKIFEKFARVKEKKLGYKTDTGLGLAFCKLAVEAHGGRIWVESEVGKGSTFTFTIPASTAQSE